MTGTGDLSIKGLKRPYNIINRLAESPTNFLTNPALDTVAKIPEFKVCAVSIERSHYK